MNYVENNYVPIQKRRVEHGLNLFYIFCSAAYE